MDKRSIKALTKIRNIIIMVGIVGGLIIWFRIPDGILNNRLIHVGNGKYGSKIGLLILLVLPVFSIFSGIKKDEIHTEDDDERVELEEEMKRATINTQICYAICESALVLILMLIAAFLNR